MAENKTNKQKRQREEKAFARVAERQQKDATNGRKRITIAQRKTRRLAVMDRQVPWSKFKEGMGGHCEQGGRSFSQL